MVALRFTSHQSLLFKRFPARPADAHLPADELDDDGLVEDGDARAEHEAERRESGRREEVRYR